MKKYLGHMNHKPNINRRDAIDTNRTEEEKKDNFNGDGSYVFLPEWRHPLPLGFGKLDTNVVYERGQFLDQWTIMYNNNETDEKALIKIRKSDSELIEFDVELAPLPS